MMTRLNTAFLSRKTLNPMACRLAAVQYREHINSVSSILERTQDLGEVFPLRARQEALAVVTLGETRLLNHDRNPITEADAEHIAAYIRTIKQLMRLQAARSAAASAIFAIMALRELL